MLEKPQNNGGGDSLRILISTLLCILCGQTPSAVLRVPESITRAANLTQSPSKISSLMSTTKSTNLENRQ